MRRVFVLMVATGLIAAGSSAVYAQQTQTPAGAEMKHGAMHHGSMKHDATKHDATKHDAMKHRDSAMDAVPAGLDTSLERNSIGSVYRASLHQQSVPATNSEMHSYVLALADPHGAPVANARISVDGGMPQHGHGLPTSPKVTEYLGDGRYLVEGVQYSMAGWWELTFGIDAGPGADKVTFNMVAR